MVWNTFLRAAQILVAKSRDSETNDTAVETGNIDRSADDYLRS
jgi:hypothetical protein